MAVLAGIWSLLGPLRVGQRRRRRQGEQKLLRWTRCSSPAADNSRRSRRMVSSDVPSDPLSSAATTLPASGTGVSRMWRCRSSFSTFYGFVPRPILPVYARYCLTVPVYAGILPVGSLKQAVVRKRTLGHGSLLFRQWRMGREPVGFPAFPSSSGTGCNLSNRSPGACGAAGHGGWCLPDVATACSVRWTERWGSSSGHHGGNQDGGSLLARGWATSVVGAVCRPLRPGILWRICLNVAMEHAGRPGVEQLPR